MQRGRRMWWRRFLAYRTWKRQQALLNDIREAKKRESQWIAAMLASDDERVMSRLRENARAWHAARQQYVKEFMRLQGRFDQLMG